MIPVDNRNPKRNSDGSGALPTAISKGSNTGRKKRVDYQKGKRSFEVKSRQATVVAMKTHVTICDGVPTR